MKPPFACLAARPVLRLCPRAAASARDFRQRRHPRKGVGAFLRAPGRSAKLDLPKKEGPRRPKEGGGVVWPGPQS